MIGNYVDDLIASVIDEFIEQTKLTGNVFTAKYREFHSFIIAEINIKKEGKTYILHEKENANKLQESSLKCSFVDFRGKKK